MSSENPLSDKPENRPPPNPSNETESTKKKGSFSGPNFRSYTTDPKKTPVHYDELTEYIKNNPKDVIAYILMIISLIMILFGSYFEYARYANLIIGLIFGLYFSEELAFLVTNIREFIEEYNLVKALVCGGTILALCLQVPLFFLGVAIITAIRILWPESKNSF
ncbi:MAG: hypothetical protein H0W50_07020 [Parachlamydiaceae bacterium]|nr:hypothetical protein [Parachlamydiaceae bacterium]